MLCDNCTYWKSFKDPFGSTDFCCLNKLSEYNKPDPNVVWIRSDNFICNEYMPKSEINKHPIAWGCRTCNQIDWTDTKERLVKLKHIPHRGYDIGNCKGKMIPLFIA